MAQVHKTVKDQRYVQLKKKKKDDAMSRPETFNYINDLKRL